MPSDKAEVTPATTYADTVPDAAAIYFTITKGMCVWTMCIYYSIIAKLVIGLMFMKDLCRQNVFT